MAKNLSASHYLSWDILNKSFQNLENSQIHHLTPWSPIKPNFDNIIAANQYPCIFLWPGGQFLTSQSEILVFGNFRHFMWKWGISWKCVKWSHSPKLIVLVPENHKKPPNLEFRKLSLPKISFQVDFWINGNVYSFTSMPRFCSETS